jgi:hypothetical protein
VRICLEIRLTMAGFEKRRSFKTGTSEDQPQVGGSHDRPRGDGDQQLFGDHGIR